MSEGLLVWGLIIAVVVGAIGYNIWCGIQLRKDKRPPDRSPYEIHPPPP